LGEYITAQYGGEASAVMAPLSKALRGYVQESARHAIDSRTLDFIGELRRVTTIFVNIVGLEGQLLTGGLSSVQQVMELGATCLGAFGGVLRQFVVDDKGCVMIGAFGLPQYSYEDNEVRAISASEDLVRALQMVGLDTSIGITNGQVYCGFVGAEKRCEYAMMGCSVNLSARLMAAAPRGTIQVDGEVFARARLAFKFERLQPIKAKGYVDPVPVFRPLGQLAADGAHGDGGAGGAGEATGGAGDPVVGATSELSVLAAMAKRVAAGVPTGPIILLGQAGSGKTHLLQSAKMHQLCARFKMRGIIAAARNVHATTPYYVWRSVLRKVFEYALASTGVGGTGAAGTGAAVVGGAAGAASRKAGDGALNATLEGAVTVPAMLARQLETAVGALAANVAADSKTAVPGADAAAGGAGAKGADPSPARQRRRSQKFGKRFPDIGADGGGGAGDADRASGAAVARVAAAGREKSDAEASETLLPPLGTVADVMARTAQDSVASPSGSVTAEAGGTDAKPSSSRGAAPALAMAAGAGVAAAGAPAGRDDDSSAGPDGLPSPAPDSPPGNVLTGAAAAVMRWCQKHCPEVAPLVPLLEDLGSWGFSVPAALAALDPDSRHRRVEKLIVEVLRAVAREGGALLVVLENAQWMDAPSLKLLLKVARGGLRAMLAVTARPLEEYYETIPHEFVTLREMGTTVEMQPFDGGECLTLARHIIGDELLMRYPEVLPAGSDEVLLDKSGGGNPLCVRNIATTLRDSLLRGQVKPLQDLPTGFFHDLIMSRFDALDAMEQTTLKAASVIGTTFSMKLLLHMLPHTSRDKRGDLHVALLKLIEANFISRTVVGKTERFNFVHPSVQETIYKMMLTDQRQSLHQICAAWYEKHYRNSMAYGSVITHHWMRSSNTCKKLQYLEEAAERAKAIMAHEQAIQHFSALTALAFGKDATSAALVSLQPYLARLQ
ncbi:unnamed protein product, partial [Phaeothamnion confervicola]